MTKKHFIALANTIRTLKPFDLEVNAGREQVERHWGASQQWERTVSDLARFCASMNGNFDRELWIRYVNGECGPHGGSLQRKA